MGAERAARRAGECLRTVAASLGWCLGCLRLPCGMSGGILHMIYDISSSCEDGEKYSRMIVSTRNFQDIRGTAAIDTLDSIGFIAPAP